MNDYLPSIRVQYKNFHVKLEICMYILKENLKLQRQYYYNFLYYSGLKRIAVQEMIRRLDDYPTILPFVLGW